VLTEEEPAPEASDELTVHPELVEWALRLRHDLGKYISMQQRWLAPDATISERKDALLADILETRRSSEGVVDAFQIWSEFWALFSGASSLSDGTVLDLSEDRDLQQVASNLEVLAGVMQALSAERIEPQLVEEGEEAARAISGACRSFSRRIQGHGVYGAVDV
jgi:hypothetical protein